MKARWVAGLVATTTALVTLGLSPAAYAEVGDDSHADATFLDATLLTGDLSTVAGIDGAHADYVDGTTAGTSDVDDANLDTTALSLLTLPLPDLEIGVGDLLHLGAVQQYAEADPDGASTSNTDTADLSLDLLQLLGANQPALSQASLNLGAVGSEATLADDGTLTRNTTIADATLNLTSPAVGDLTTGLTDTFSTLNTQLTGLEDVIEGAVNDSVGQILDLVGSTGTATSDTTVTIDTSRLDQAVSGLLTQTLKTDLVSIDLSTGTITVNLAGGIDLNDLDPNTTLLDADTLQAVSADVASLLSQLQTDVNKLVTDALDYVDVTIDSTSAITVPIVGTNLGGIDIDYSGSVQDLIDGSAPLTIDGTGATGTLLDPVLDGATGIVQDVVGAAVNTAISTALDTAGQAVDTTVTTATNALQPAFEALGDVAQVNLNVQNDSDGLSSQADVTAVQVVLLPGTDALELNLATSSVGPNDQVTYTPSLDAGSPVAAGDSTTVTGGGWPPNTEVTLQLTDADGDPVGDPVTVTTTADGDLPDGTTYAVPGDTAPGDYTLTGTTADGTSATDTVTVTDETAPDAPVIEDPAGGSSTSDTTPTISGTAEPGSTVDVYLDTDGDGQPDGDPIGTATADDDGNWSLVPDEPLDAGDHTIVATATDASGNESDPSNAVDFTIDTTAPDAPVITEPADDSATADNTPTISGTGEAGDTVTVTDGNGDTLCTATVADDGTWTCDSVQLADGSYTITATQTDAAGNDSPASDPVTFTVDTDSPAAPVITGPADDTTVADSTPTITGTGEAGDTVTVTDQDGTTLCTTTVGPDGTWSCDSEVELADGDHTLTATQTDEAGNTSPASDPIDITVDTSEDAPTISTPESGSSTNDNTPTISGTGDPGATVTVTTDDGTELGTAVVDDDGNWSLDSTQLDDDTYTITATQSDAAGNDSLASDPVIFTVDTQAPDAPAITAPEDGDTVATGTPEITGTGEAGDTVTVTDENGDTVCETTVADDGTWSCTPDTALADGDHTLTAAQTDPAGNASAPSDPVHITVDTTAPDAPVITSPSGGDVLDTGTPTITGTGEAGDSVIVTDEDGATLCTATVQDDGTWTCTIPDGKALADGDHTLTATQTDEAGNTSPASDPVDITVDTTAPDAPSITAPGDGDTLATGTPEITGTGEAGDTVTVTDENGDTVCETTVADDGTWSCTPDTALTDGDHTLTATQTDEAGNTSPASDPVHITVDTTAPDAPVIEGPVNGAVLSDTTPTISGTGEAGDTVTVTADDGTVLGTTTVNDDGNWSLDSTQLDDDTYTITATQTDAADNESPASDPVTFTVDTTAPDAPAITLPDDGATTGDNTPTISGTGEAGDTVTVTDENGDTVCETTVADDGTWSCTPDT
ncbi:Ig-like domain-containing protein, partial [Nocardioides sp. DS6]